MLDVTLNFYCPWLNVVLESTDSLFGILLVKFAILTPSS